MPEWNSTVTDWNWTTTHCESGMPLKIRRLPVHHRAFPATAETSIFFNTNYTQILENNNNVGVGHVSLV